MNMQNEIAIRLYDNNKYGTTYGKGMYHHALFNATADVKNPKAKYLLDFYSYAHWEAQAKTDAQMEVVDLVKETADKDTLVSWVLRYDVVTKHKTFITGFCMLNLATNKLQLVIADDALNLQTAWNLPVKPCKLVRDKNAPQLLATNAELCEW